MRRRTPADAAPSADTLYFGGGTPSLLAAPRLRRLVESARSLHGLPSGAEITVEANPKDLDPGGYVALRETGANRLSLGVQHFDDTVLADMGRVHRSVDNEGSMKAARRAGFDNVSIDLILGWPGENPGRWADTLERALALEPDHVSLYVLEVDGRNVLAHQERAGTLLLPDDDLVADLYLATVDALEHAGIRRYEISNFARQGRESRHNGKYWDDKEFLGFGLSAHSYASETRSWNEPTFGRYAAAVEAGGTGQAGFRTLSNEERLAEALFTGLRRRDGIDLDTFRRRYGVDVKEAFGGRLRDAFGAGLLEETQGGLRLTLRGVLLSNEVFRAFV